MNCESCGMPMKKSEDHSCGDPKNRYCKYCAPNGKLKSREEIREGWINATMRMQGLSREEAEKKVDEIMPEMPAWKND